MKKIVKAASAQKPNKTQMRSEFVQIATSIRDMGNYEFMELLKNNDFETASSWIEQIRNFYEQLQSQAESVITYYVANVSVDGEFVGYIKKCSYKRDPRGKVGNTYMSVTSSIDKAMKFTSMKEANVALSGNVDARGYSDIIVINYEENVGYSYEHPNNPEVIGKLDELASDINDMNVYYVGNVAVDLEEV